MSNKYSIEIKLNACKDYFEKGKGTTMIADELNIHHSVVNRWIKKYERGGIDELSIETRGKVLKGKKKFIAVEDELEYVKAERDLLKKILQILKK